jgi:hypothetical protein
MAICHAWKCSIIAADLRCKISIEPGVQDLERIVNRRGPSPQSEGADVDMIYGQGKLNHFGASFQVGTVSINVHLWTSAAQQAWSKGAGRGALWRSPGRVWHPGSADRRRRSPGSVTCAPGSSEPGIGAAMRGERTHGHLLLSVHRCRDDAGRLGVASRAWHLRGEHLLGMGIACQTASGRDLAWLTHTRRQGGRRGGYRPWPSGRRRRPQRQTGIARVRPALVNTDVDAGGCSVTTGAYRQGGVEKTGSGNPLRG